MKPITMQDVRLCAGEGKLDAATVLAACNTIINRTLRAAPASSESLGVPQEDTKPFSSPSPSEALHGASTEGEGEEFLEFKEALDDLRSLRSEHRDLNGGGPGWSARWEAAWANANDLFANEDEAAWCRQQEDAHG